MLCKNLGMPVWILLAKVFALWAFVNVGCYVVLPLFGFDASYNANPVIIALLFLVWAFLCILCFRDVFDAWRNEGKSIRIFRWIKPKKPNIRIIVMQSVAGAILLCLLLVMFSLFPALRGPTFAPYTDIVLSTPWYFLPKSMEILVQQILLTAFVLVFHLKYRSFKKVIVGYLLFFGGAHFLYAFTGTPTPYWMTVTAAALLSAAVFPYLILRVRGGFVFTYMLHLCFYIVLAMLIHIWPPPGYFS